MFCNILSWCFHREIKTQGSAHMKLVETEQDVPEKYLYCHKRDTQGINYQYPKIKEKMSVILCETIYYPNISLFQNMWRGIFQRQ